MKKYFRIISKLIEKHGNDKRVIKHIIRMNNYMISNLTHHGGNPDKDFEITSNIISEMSDVLRDTLNKLYAEGQNVQEVKKLLATMNAELSKLI
jgi:hypothetical protein